MELVKEKESEVLLLMLKLPEDKRKIILEELHKIDQLMQQLDAHIEKSKAGILNLKDNWDNEGSRGYTQEIWERAIGFLREFFKQIWARFVIISFPNILPGPDGSIDLNWDTDPVNIIINIPRELNELVSFYGEHQHKKEIEGSIELSLVDSVLIPWLMCKQ